tara:strand:- start:453 stop:740 length:288 start_codon:yes stop_codon:yes gene_type:complete
MTKDKQPKGKDVGEIRTKEERMDEVREIINQLNTFELTVKYEPVQKLMRLLNNYVKNGDRIKVSIPFPEINRTIRGILATNKKERVFIKLHYEKY